MATAPASLSPSPSSSELQCMRLIRQRNGAAIGRNDRLTFSQCDEHGCTSVHILAGYRSATSSRQPSQIYQYSLHYYQAQSLLPFLCRILSISHLFPQVYTFTVLLYLFAYAVSDLLPSDRTSRPIPHNYHDQDHQCKRVPLCTILPSHFLSSHP